MPVLVLVVKFSYFAIGKLLKPGFPAILWPDFLVGHQKDWCTADLLWSWWLATGLAPKSVDMTVELVSTPDSPCSDLWAFCRLWCGKLMSPNQQLINQITNKNMGFLLNSANVQKFTGLSSFRRSDILMAFTWDCSKFKTLQAACRHRFQMHDDDRVDCDRPFGATVGLGEKPVNDPDRWWIY